MDFNKIDFNNINFEPEKETGNELKIELTSKLEYTIDQKQKVKDFMKALNELPKTLEIKISTDGGETWSKKGIEINLMKLIGEVYFGNKNN
jgi:hypothetical protein